MWFREWLVLSILIGIIVSIGVSNYFSKISAEFVSKHQKKLDSQALIEINVTGEVLFPGVYKFCPGISLKEVIDRAGLTSNSDRKKINFHRKVFHSMKIEVPQKEPVKRNRKQRTNINNKT